MPNIEDRPVTWGALGALAVWLIAIGGIVATVAMWYGPLRFR